MVTVRVRVMAGVRIMVLVTVRARITAAMRTMAKVGVVSQGGVMDRVTSRLGLEGENGASGQQEEEDGGWEGGRLPTVSPGVQLVHRAVHPHGDLEGLLAAALPHAVDDARQPGGAHLRSPRGHALAHHAHDVAVRARGQQPKGCEDVVDLLAVA